MDSTGVDAMDSIQPGTCDETVSIEDVLPHECLAHIFTFLNVRQLIGIERVCKRWRKESQTGRSRKKFLNFNDLIPEIDNELSVETKHVSQILSKCRKHLNSLHVELGWGMITIEEVLQLIGDCCVNLQNLSLDLSWEELEFVPESFRNMLKNLKSLTIYGYVDSTHLGVFLKEAENLERFVMRRVSDDYEQLWVLKPFDDMTGNFKHIELHCGTSNVLEYVHATILSGLAKLKIFNTGALGEHAMSTNTTLRVLVLTGLESKRALQDGYIDDCSICLNKVLQQLTNLKILKIEDFPRFSPSALRPSRETLEELQLPLRFSSPEHEGAWPLFPNLRILKKVFHGPEEKILATLLRQCPNLEELDISDYAWNLNELSFLIHLPKLRRLAVNGSLNINGKWLKLISDYMSTKLESFECTKIRWDGDEILSLVRQCENLTELKADLPNKEKFSEEALKIIESNPERKLLRFYHLPFSSVSNNDKNDHLEIGIEDNLMMREYRTEAGRLLLQVFVVCGDT